MNDAIMDVALQEGVWGHAMALDADGLALHDVKRGHGSPTVLLLHGWPGFWYDLRSILPLLVETTWVIAMDLRVWQKCQTRLAGSGVVFSPAPGEKCPVVARHFTAGAGRGRRLRCGWTSGIYTGPNRTSASASSCFGCHPLSWCWERVYCCPKHNESVDIRTTMHLHKLIRSLGMNEK